MAAPDSGNHPGGIAPDSRVTRAPLSYDMLQEHHRIGNRARPSTCSVKGLRWRAQRQHRQMVIFGDLEPPLQRPQIVLLGAGASRAACPNGDRNGRELPVLTNLVEVVGLQSLLTGVPGIEGLEGFENIYGKLVADENSFDLVTELEARIRGYFEQLALPDYATVYDRLVLSLREKDVIATFNWDPLLIQACRRHSDLVKLPQIACLHGNVGMGFCSHCKAKGYIDLPCGLCGRPFDPFPLLFPVSDKDYSSHPLIRNEWALLRHQLKHAFLFMAYGYSLPKTDAAAKALLELSWGDNDLRSFAQTEIIDILAGEDESRDRLEQTWKPFIHSHHYGFGVDLYHTWLWRYPRRSCEGLFAAVMQNSPWSDRPLPESDDLSNLRDAVRDLVEQEGVDETMGCGLPRFVRVRS